MSPLGVCPCPPARGVSLPPEVSHLALPVDTDVVAVLPAGGPVHHGRRPLRVEVEALGQAVEGTGLDTPWGRSQSREKVWKTRRMSLEEGARPWSWAQTPGGTLSLLHSLRTWAGCDREGNRGICSYLGHSWHFTSCKTLLPTLPTEKLRQQLLSYLSKVRAPFLFQLPEQNNQVTGPEKNHSFLSEHGDTESFPAKVTMAV